MAVVGYKSRTLAIKACVSLNFAIVFLQRISFMPSTNK
jgi:hypothetical protein